MSRTAAFNKSNGGSLPADRSSIVEIRRSGLTAYLCPAVLQ